MDDLRPVLDEAVPHTRFRACVYAAAVGWDALLYDSGDCEWAGRLLPPVVRSGYASTWRWTGMIGTLDGVGTRQGNDAWLRRLTRWVVGELEKVGAT